MNYLQFKTDILEKFIDFIESSSLVYRFTSFNLRRSFFGGFCLDQIDKSSFFYSNVVFTFKIKKDKLFIGCKYFVLSDGSIVHPINKKLEVDLPKSSEEFVNFYSFELPRLIFSNYKDSKGITLFETYRNDQVISNMLTRDWYLYFRDNYFLRNVSISQGGGVFIDNSNQSRSRFNVRVENEQVELVLLNRIKKEQELKNKKKVDELFGEVVF